MTAFPYTDPTQALRFALGYFERLKADVDIRATWLKLRALVQVKIHSPDIRVYVDTRDGTEMKIVPGVTPEKPALTLSLSADDFHRIYTGQLNVVMAFATGKIKTRGNAGLIMRTTWTLARLDSPLAPLSLSPLAPAEIETMANIFREAGLTVVVGGA